MADVLGKCPKCGADVTVGQYGSYCTGKCGMSLGYAMGKKLTDDQVKSLLAGKKILMKGLVSKKSGNEYDAYLKPTGVEPYSYTNKNGEEKSGYQFKFEFEFPDKGDKKKSGNNQSIPKQSESEDTYSFEDDSDDGDEYEDEGFSTDDFSDDDEEDLPF